jgi:List-Bact-rpt repeat protein
VAIVTDICEYAYSVRGMTRPMAFRTLAAALVLLAFGVGGAAGRAYDTPTTTIRVEVMGGALVSGGGQFACGGGSTNCYGTFVTNGDITLTATEQGDWSFSSWGGDCDETDGEDCLIHLDGGNKEVTANFSPGTNPGNASLTVNNTSDSSTGGGNVSGGQIDCDTSDQTCSWDNLLVGSTVTVVETPDSGFTFSGWGGPCSGTAPSCSVQVSGDVTVNATFAKSASTFALTASVTGNGVVAGGGISCSSAGGSTCSAEEPAGTAVTLIAQPGSGASFNGWGGACAGTSLSCSVTMSSAKSVTASFSGASPTPPAADFPLGVSVTGDGTVSGGGIRCGSTDTTCTVNQTSGSTVTLTETPDTGATFKGWGGACSGTATTCSVTMNAAKSVTATFSTSGGGGSIGLSVTVTGPGSVAGGGIRCGNGARTCTAQESQGSTVTLTATPAANATFVGWDGACSGSDTTCTVTMDASKSVSAAFKRTGRTSAGVGSVKKLQIRGRAVVRRSSTGFRVTLRFVTPRRGLAHVRALLAGRLQTALSFTVAPGRATVGPFPVVKPGFYVFEVALGVQRLRWTACLGRCGAAAHARPFVLARGPAKAIDAGALWSLAVKFHASMPSAARLRILRSGRLARDVRFAPPAGAVVAGPFLLSPGTYQLRLTATDAYGRVRRLTWYAFLP